MRRGFAFLGLVPSHHSGAAAERAWRGMWATWPSSQARCLPGGGFGRGFHRQGWQGMRGNEWELTPIHLWFPLRESPNGSPQILRLLPGGAGGLEPGGLDLDLNAKWETKWERYPGWPLATKPPGKWTPLFVCMCCFVQGSNHWMVCMGRFCFPFTKKRHPFGYPSWTLGCTRGIFKVPYVATCLFRVARGFLVCKKRPRSVYGMSIFLFFSRSLAISAWGGGSHQMSPNEQLGPPPARWCPTSHPFLFWLGGKVPY